MTKPISITSPFWSPRLLTNTRAIFHQWQQLEASGCIDNFRIAAGEKEGLRAGWFFADSDAYKWLDAAARTFAGWNVETLERSDLQTCQLANIQRLAEEFLELLSRAQMDDGYLYTYNQIHFPGSRWENLLIEHELYCHGHLIEAGVSHFEATGGTSALSIARKAADLLVRDFMDAPPAMTDGHEEVEIALLRLYQVTGHAPYLDLATALLERRGRARFLAPALLRQNARVAARGEIVRQRREAYLAAHPGFEPHRIPPGNHAKKPPTALLRWQWSALTGKYFQMHAPLRKQTVPVGHAVRFGYLETATAMLMRLTGDRSLLPALEQAWDRMVTRRMYVTGGIGSLPALEGFGRDYELDPEIAYAETCAALASLFWNWEMAQITGAAKYSDLFEWQLYNAAAPGMGLDGIGYLYNNPLACRGVERRPWFAVPCCPSNLSRTWASLGKYIYSSDKNDLWVHQYIGSELTTDDGQRTTKPSPLLDVKMESSLPWEGRASLTVRAAPDSEAVLHLRLPSWAGNISIRVNDMPIAVPNSPLTILHSPSTASGYDPRTSTFFPITRTWQSGDIVELDFEMPITLRRASPRVRGHRGKVTVTRGPLVYCLESADNPDVDIFSARLDTSHALSAAYAPTLLGGTEIISGKTTDGKDLTFISYHLWANRGPSQMTVWVKT
jgi:DUF1680 family protein